MTVVSALVPVKENKVILSVPGWSCDERVHLRQGDRTKLNFSVQMGDDQLSVGDRARQG